MDILQILFFAGLAVFLGVRLYMVLASRPDAPPRMWNANSASARKPPEWARRRPPCARKRMKRRLQRSSPARLAKA